MPPMPLPPMPTEQSTELPLGQVAIAPDAGRIGRAFGTGATWMMSATILIKVLGIGSQIALGKLLTREDFGLYAIAVAVCKLITICQDGGVRDLLVQKKPEEYPSLSGRIFWFAMVFNTAVALLIGGLAWPVAHLWYHEDRLVPMFIVLAIAVPLGTPGSILQAKLRLDFKFAATSWIVIASGIIRQIGAVSLALAACGTMSFVIPAVLAAITETLMGWWLAKDSPWKRSPEFGTWMNLYKEAEWLIYGSIANLLIDRGPYLVMQPLLRWGGVAVVTATGVTGDYFWAFEISAQLAALLSSNMQLVLTPVMARLKDDIPRLRAATMRTMSGLMMIGSFASLAMAVMMDPLEGFVFNGKWAAATPVVAIFGLFSPFKLLYGLTTAVQVGTGKFKAWCLLSFAEGIVFTVAGGAVAFVAAKGWFPNVITVDAVSLACVTGGTLAVARIWATVWVMHQVGARRRAVLVEMTWPWLLAVLSGAIAYSLDNWLSLAGLIQRHWNDKKTVCEITIAASSGFAGWFATLVHRFGLSAGADARIIEGARFLILGATITIAFATLARVLMPDVLWEACRVLPGPLGRMGQKLLRLAPAKE